MTDIAIRVDNLSKLYHIGALQQRHDTLRDALTGFLPRTLAPYARAGVSQITRINGRKNQSNPSNQWQDSDDTNLWALKDVSFEVKRSEVASITFTARLEQ